MAIRIAHHSLLAASLFAAATATGLRRLDAAQPAPPPAGAVERHVPPEEAALVIEAERAGLRLGTVPEVLTWERAYRLALVRSRSAQAARGRGPAESLDLKALDDQSRRLGLDNFARFRTEFLGRPDGPDTPGATFRDPSAALLDVLRRRQAVETARENVIRYEQLFRVVVELIQGEASGLTRLDVDQCDDALQEARSRLAEELTRYRDRLEELKLDLGLSPHAPVVPDRNSLKVFRDTFEAAQRWSANPKRDLDELPALARQLPRLDDVALDFVAGQSVLAAVREPNRLEGILSAVERAAVRNKDAKEGDAGLALDVRRSVRKLLDTARAYDLEATRLILTLRMQDQALARLIAPRPDGLAPVSSTVRHLIAPESRVSEREDRLVSLWTSFQAGRIALYRQLGTFPYNDWASFSAQFRAERGDDGNDPRKVQGIPQPGVVAPPAPPAPAPAPPARRPER